MALGLGAALLTGWAPTGWADSADSADGAATGATSGSSSGSSGPSESSGSSGTAQSQASADSDTPASGDTAGHSTDTDTDTDTDAQDAPDAADDSGETESATEGDSASADDPSTDAADTPSAAAESDAEADPDTDSETARPATGTERSTGQSDATTSATEDPEPEVLQSDPEDPDSPESDSGPGDSGEDVGSAAADADTADADDTQVLTVSVAATDAETEADETVAEAVAAPLTSTLLDSSATPSGDDTPAAETGLWAILAFVGREFEKLFFNSHPVASPVITSQTDDLAIGTFGAVDADGDELTYTILGRGPALGQVSIDQATGTFVYTPVVDFSVLGGSDSFTVEISDGFRLHGLDSFWEIPVQLIRSIPVIGSLLSDFLPRTSTTVTVTINFTGTGELTDLVFPDGFHWGVATSGFQSEMGGDAPLDENSDWWQWLHDPLNQLLLGWNSDALPENGPDSYDLYATDAQLAAQEVGADTFRLGIEWSRIFPNSTASVDISGGFTEDVLQELDALADQDAVSHYRDVLETLLSYGLDPMVTINHFTLPIWVHDPSEARLEEILGQTPDEEGGWVSDSTVTEFEKYAAYLAYEYGDLVTNWIVLNEPMNSMIPAYYGIPFGTGFPSGVFRPDLMAKGLLNQAAAYSASYDIIHQLDDDANVGLALSMWDWRAADATSEIDQQAAEQFSEFFNTWFPDAVINGEIDANFDGVIDADEIHPELAGKADFIGVNYYGQGSVIGWGGSPFESMPVLTGYPQFSNLLNVLLGGCPAEECSDAPTVIKPSGLRDMLDIAASYGVPLWITENGLADADDDQRASYLVRHLAVVSEAINDGIDIRGYITWSLLDNLEWILGYEPEFGLYSWDPETLERTARPSVAVLNQIFTSNSIPAELFQQYLVATGSLS